MGSLPSNPLIYGALGHNHLPSLSVFPKVGVTSCGAPGTCSNANVLLG